jgi:hypothetical protein
VDHFVRLRPRGAGTKAGGEVHGHGFGNESGARVELEDAPPVRSGITRFLKKLALGGGESSFAWIDAPGREFPQIIVRSVAVLALQQYTRLRMRLIDGQNYHRAGVMNDIATGANASGFLHVVSGYPKDWAAIYRAGRNESRLGA